MRDLLAEASQAILNMLGGTAKATGCVNSQAGGCGYCTCCKIAKVLSTPTADLSKVRLWVEPCGMGWLQVGDRMWMMPDHGFGWRCSSAWRAKDLPKRFEVTDIKERAAAIAALERFLDSQKLGG